MIGFKAFTFLLATLFTAACSTEHTSLESTIASHSTQSWNFVQGTQPLSMVAASGSCASNRPFGSFSAGYCFNEIPAAVVNISLPTATNMVGFCLATHLPGMSSSAALLVVDANGQLISEVTSNGNMQMLDSFTRNGRYTIYVGFPSAAAGQKATLRLASLSEFALSSPACSLR